METATIKLERYEDFKRWEKVAANIERLNFSVPGKRYELICPTEIHEKLFSELKNSLYSVEQLTADNNALSKMVIDRDAQISDLKSRKWYHLIFKK